MRHCSIHRPPRWIAAQLALRPQRRWVWRACVPAGPANVAQPSTLRQVHVKRVALEAPSARPGPHLYSMPCGAAAAARATSAAATNSRLAAPGQVERMCPAAVRARSGLPRPPGAPMHSPVALPAAPRPHARPHKRRAGDRVYAPVRLLPWLLVLCLACKQPSGSLRAQNDGQGVNRGDVFVTGTFNIAP
jgi:hypothetical protein